MRTLAIVPARAGSKGIPHKNTRLFRGLPLLAHAIKCGQETCDRTFVTTDDKGAAEIAIRHAAFLIWRPPALAADDTPMLPVIQHALSEIENPPDVIVLLQPSSPTVRRAEYVRRALLRLESSMADSVVSVSEIPAHYSPDYAVEVESNGLLRTWRGLWPLGGGPQRRQDCSPAYLRDGTVYATRSRVIQAGTLYGIPYAGIQCHALIIPASDSVTLDTEEDWPIGEAKHA